MILASNIYKLRVDWKVIFKCSKLGYFGHKEEGVLTN